MAPLVDLDGWKKKNRKASRGGASKGRKRSTALGDLRASKWHKSKKEAQKNKSNSNSQEESNEACSDSLPPTALLVDDEGGGSPALGELVSKKHKEEEKSVAQEESKKVIRDDSEEPNEASPPDPMPLVVDEGGGSPALGELVSKKHKEEEKSVAQEESKKVIRDDSEEPNEASPPDPMPLVVDEGGASKGRPALCKLGRSRFWDQFEEDFSDDDSTDDDLTYDDAPPDPSDPGRWYHNHEECIKSFNLYSDYSHVSPYSSPPREPNVLPYNLDDPYELDPRWFDRSLDVCLEEIRQEIISSIKKKMSNYNCSSTHENQSSSASSMRDSIQDSMNPSSNTKPIEDVRCEISSKVIANDKGKEDKPGCGSSSFENAPRMDSGNWNAI